MLAVQQIIDSCGLDIAMLSPLQIELLESLREGPITRAELAEKLDRPRTTIYDNLSKLQTLNVIYKYPRPTNFRGRPIVLFSLNVPKSR